MPDPQRRFKTKSNLSFPKVQTYA